MGIPSRDSFLMIQYLFVRSDHQVKELMPLREGRHMMMHYYMRQHDACLHSVSWRECTRMKFTKGSITYFMKRSICRWNVQKIRSESSENMWKTTGVFINSWRINWVLASNFEQHAQEMWERNWMNPEMQIALLNMYNPKLMETILKALRGQCEEDDQMDTAEEIADLVPEIPLECEQILKE